MEGHSGYVLVVDDDENHLRFLTIVLERAGYHTAVARTGEQALAAARSKPPGLVVLDVKLPGISGYQVCRELKDAHGGEVSVILASGVRTEPFDRAAGLLVGADDCISKPFDVGEFLARVRRCVPPVMRTSRPAAGGASVLTRRELEVLDLLAEGLGQGEIADRLVITPKTVATHIQHILKKLGVHSRAQAVAFAHSHGLRTLAG